MVTFIFIILLVILAALDKYEIQEMFPDFFPVFLITVGLDTMILMTISDFLTKAIG
jgi:hypothetical protein